MADMDFTEAYDTVCPNCERSAGGGHRLTRAGNLYCLSYNADSHWLYRDKNVNMFTIHVRHLIRSPLGKDVGAVLDYNLHSLDNAARLAQNSDM